MKKMLKISITLLIIVLLSIIHVNATNTKTGMSVNKTKVKVGEQFEVSINVDCNNFQGLTGKLVFDKEKLKLVKNDKDKVIVEDGYNTSNMNGFNSNGDYIVSIFLDNRNQTITNQMVQTLTFEVLSGVQNNEELYVSLVEIQMLDGNERIIDQTASTKTKVDENISLTSTKYAIDFSNNIIKNIMPKTDVNTLKTNLSTNATQVRAYKGETILNDRDLVTTNTIVKLENEFEQIEFTLIVKGDINEDGFGIC